MLVRIEATGVCHSDLHVIEEDGWGHPFPVLLGHEGAGTVEAVGAGVDALSRRRPCRARLEGGVRALRRVSARRAAALPDAARRAAAGCIAPTARC